MDILLFLAGFAVMMFFLCLGLVAKRLRKLFK